MRISPIMEQYCLAYVRHQSELLDAVALFIYMQEHGNKPMYVPNNVKLLFKPRQLGNMTFIKHLVRLFSTLISLDTKLKHLL
jgi:hypothetical protein